MHLDLELLEGLKDAGCSPEEIKQFKSYFENNNMKEGLRVLEKCRKTCLLELHDKQRKIDTLDYVIYKLQRNGDVS